MSQGKSRKRPRCSNCGQFTGTDHRCSREELTDAVIQCNGSFEASIETNQALGILYIIPHSCLAVSSIKTHFIREICSTLGISSSMQSLPCNDVNNVILPKIRPNSIKKIWGDGNCLFTALGVFVGLPMNCGPTVRDIIVGNVHLVTFPEECLQTSEYSDDFPNRSRVIQCTSIEDYLNKSKMAEDGVHGGCIEIFTFCQLFKVDVYVWHSLWRLWLLYPCQSNNQRSGVFIQQSLLVNHFDVIVSFDVILPHESNQMVDNEQNQPQKTCEEPLKSNQNIQNVIETQATILVTLMGSAVGSGTPYPKENTGFVK